MKLTPHDWKLLQLPILGGVVALVCMVLCVGYTYQQADQAQQVLENQKNQLNTARQKFQTSGAEKETIAKYMPRYLDQVKRGFIGEERRIEWIDVLRNINQQYKLFGISYSIGAQETFKPAFNLSSGNFVLHRSTMKIEAPLLHEGDLLTMLAVLSSQESSPFMARDCTLIRLPRSAKNKLLPALNSSCELDWITVTEPARTGGKP